MEFHTTEDKLLYEKAGGEDLGEMHSAQREWEHRSGCTAHSVPMPSCPVRIGAASEVGVVELFFSNAVQLTIIPQWIFPLTVVSVTLILFPAQQDTNDLTKTKMALGGFCWSVFNFKQMTVDILQAGNTAEPTASGVYEFEECWCRMLLYVSRTKCKCNCTERSSFTSFSQVNHITLLRMNRLNRNNVCLVTLVISE